MTNDRFDGIATFEWAFESSGIYAAFLPGFVNRDARELDAPVAQIDKHFFGAGAAQNFRLFQTRLQCVSIIGITREAAGTQHEIALIGDGYPYLDAKLVFFVYLALGNTLHFRGVKAVQLVFILGLLSQNTLRFLQGVLEGQLDGIGLVKQVTIDIPVNPSHQGFQLFEHLAFAIHLLGMTVAALPCSYPTTGRIFLPIVFTVKSRHIQALDIPNGFENRS